MSKDFPESFDPLVPNELVYSGSNQLTDKMEGVRLLYYICANINATQNLSVHCSGGAQTKVLHFVDHLHVIKDNLFEIPPLFDLIQKESETSWKELYRVYNMWQRMELYVPEEIAKEVIAITNTVDLQAQVIGRVEASDKKELTIVSDKGTFHY